MATELRTPTVLLAITLFSIVTAVGQINTNKARKITGTAVSAGYPDRTRPESQGRPSSTAKSLPFEKTVTIYYGRKMEPAASADRPVGDLRREIPISGGPSRGMKEGSKSRALGIQPPSGSRAPLTAQMPATLQPVLIYYKTYRSIAPGGSTSQPIVESSLKTATASVPIISVPTIMNASPDTPARRKETSSISSPDVFSDARRIPKLRETTSEVKAAGNGISSATLDPGSNVTQTGSSGTPTGTTTATAPSVPSRPLDHQAILASEVAPIASAVEENTEKPAVAGSEPVGLPIEAKKVATSRENSGNGAVIADVPTTPAVSIPETGATELTANPNSLSSSSRARVDREADSMDPVTLNNSAVGLTLEKQYTEARTLLQRAIDAQPDVGKFHRNLSIVFERMKMIDEALASARTGEKLSPSDPSVVEQLCGLELETGNSTAACECYERLGSIHPLDGLSSTYYGIALYRSGKEDESIAVLEKAANSTPAIPLAINALGVVYYNKKRFKDAAAAFKSAVEAAPDTFEFRYNLALTHLALGNKTGASSQYNILKAGNPALATRLFGILYGDKIVVVPKN